jgi:hypothetical protein
VRNVRLNKSLGKTIVKKSKGTKKKKQNNKVDSSKKHLTDIDLGDNYIHRFALIENLPFFEIIFLKFNGYNKLKNDLIVSYNKLIKKESNIDQYFIDAELGIKLKIDTINSSYEIMIDNRVLINDKFYFNGDIKELIGYIEASRGVFIHIACNDYSNKIEEELIINVLNVIVNNNKVYEVNELNGIDTFLSLPNREWYKEGNNSPGELAVACTLEIEPENPEGIVILGYPNNDIYKQYDEFFKENLILEDDFATNLNLIIEEIKDNVIMVKVELMDVGEKNILYETVVPITTSQIYLNFKYCLKENGYVLLLLKEGFSFNKMD